MNAIKNPVRLAATAALLVAALTANVCQAAQPVVLDNDWAIDDWTSLLYLAHHPGVELRGVTVTGSGEAHCPGALEQLPRLMDLAGVKADVPYDCSNPAPLDGWFVFPEPWRTDSDRLSGVQLPASTRKPAGIGAVALLHRVANAGPDKIIVVATGPLTNIAQWFEQYPGDISRIDRLVIMGGAVRAKGNIIVPQFTAGHPNHVSEWNFYIDALAAQKVLRSSAPITLVPLDVTNHVRVTAEFASAFKQRVRTPSARFVDQVFDRNDWFIASGEYYFWDVLAAIVAPEPAICRSEQIPLDVVVAPASAIYAKGEDPSLDAKRWDGAPRRHLDASNAGRSVAVPVTGPRHRVCLDTRADEVMAKFTDVMNR
ncbi:hypothetical protein BH09PSE6_BH09PSE6_33960 [soil metagenome]